MGNGSLAAGLIGGVLGAVLGASAMLAWAPPGAPATNDASPDPTALQAAVERALAPLVAELREARGADERARRATGPTAPAGVAPVERPAVRPEVIARGVEDDATSRRDLRPAGIRWTPEPRLERLRDLHGFMGDASVRQRWLFTGQQEALSWFGTPTLVYTPGGSEEMWEYELPNGVDEDGDEATVEYRLMFVHGRLAQVHGDGAKVRDDE